MEIEQAFDDVTPGGRKLGKFQYFLFSTVTLGQVLLACQMCLMGNVYQVNLNIWHVYQEVWSRTVRDPGPRLRVKFVNSKKSCADSTFDNRRKPIFIYDEYRLLKGIINISAWSIIWKSSHRTNYWYKRPENSIFCVFFFNYSSTRKVL